MSLNASSTFSQKEIFVDQDLDSSKYGLRFIIYNQFVGKNLYKNPYYSNKDLYNYETKIVPTGKSDFYKFIQINTLITKGLTKPIFLEIEFDEKYFIVRSVDLPLYACGNDTYEAIQNIKRELENVYFELMEDDDFSDEWMNYKNFFKSIIIDK
jgi:hypothetical protein